MKKIQFKKPNLKTKRGVASLYVVIFATILFGVITVSFTRIILSEATQSSNDDLSQSAYDSAMAGVEDAKVAVNNYHKCVQEKGAAQCENKNVFSGREQHDDDCSQGFPLAKVLYGTNFTGEVKIQESGQTNSETFVDQAYTCVIISDITPDYRGTLTSDTRTRVVPLAVNGSGINSEEIGQVSKVKFSWYSELNQGSNIEFSLAGYDDESEAWVLPDYTGRTTPPAMQITLIKASATADLSNFWNSDNNSEVLYSSLLLLPADGDKVVSSISKSTIAGAGNVISSYNKDNHKPFGVECASGYEFVCNIDLEVADGTGRLLNNGDNVFLVVNMPYGDAFTDFKVELAKTNEAGVESKINFQGSQISVDSTGRTNQLYRRVEARLDAADIFFPYPEFELSSTDGGGTNIEKNSWVTSNCWHSWYTKDGWSSGACDNNGTVKN